MNETFFKNKGFKSAGFFNLAPSEAYKEATENNAAIVDVREQSMVGYKCFDVPVVIYAPNSRLDKYYQRLPKDKPLIIADSAGLHSREAMQFLKSKGFTKIANLAGGLVEWDRDNLPLKIDSNETLSGACVCRLRPRKKLSK